MSDFLHHTPKINDPKASRGSAEARDARAVEGGGPSVNWDALAPQIDHPTRRLIVDEIEGAGEALSTRDLHDRLGTDELPKSRIGYHLQTLVDYGVLEEAAERVTPDGFEPVYYFPARA